MSNTPSRAEIEALVKRHGATSYRNRADTQHPAYGFTEDGLNGLIDEVLAKWGTPAQAAEPVAWLDPWTGTKVTTDYDAYGKYGIPLYTAPQPVVREPLTPSQYNTALGCATDIPPSRYEAVTRAIERAHGITQKGGS